MLPKIEAETVWQSPLNFNGSEMKKLSVSTTNHPFELIVLLAIYTSIGALSIDLQLPAMPLILQSFGLTENNQQQWIITAYMLGFASAQIFYGPISDSVGRKPVLLFGLGLYIFASLLCLWTESYFGFLAARALQGVGAAAARIMVNAITRDFFKGNEMARVTSLVMIIFIMVPVMAPSLGSLILWLGPWQHILYVFVLFGLLALVWTLVRLPESLTTEHKKPLSFHQLKNTFLKVIKEPVSMAFAVVSGVIFSGFMAYLNSAEQLFSHIYEVKQYFPYIFGVIALFFGLAAFINSKIVMKYGAVKVTYFAMIVMVITNLLMWVLSYLFAGLPPLALFIVVLVIVNVCIGLIYGNVMAIAMYPLGAHAGMGASVIGMVSALIAAGLGIFISQQLTNTIMPVVSGFFMTSLLALIITNRFKSQVNIV